MNLPRLRLLLAQERRRAEWGAKYYLRHARTGHRPVIVGRPRIENRRLEIGDDFLLWSRGRGTSLLGSGRIVIGDRVFINSGAIVDAAELVEIGDDVALAIDAYVADNHSHGLEGRPRESRPVRVGAGSWVGLRAVVMPGVTIGRRCVVAAHAVVRNDVPDDTLVAGVPARPVRRLHYPPGVVRAWQD